MNIKDTEFAVQIPVGQSLNSLPSEEAEAPAAIMNRTLLKVLASVPGVDFREELDLEEDEKPKLKHVIVATVDKILEITRQQRLGLTIQGDFLYVFNGKYHEVVEAREFKNFLGGCAIQMWQKKYDKVKKIHLLETKHHTYRNELFNQFLAVGYFPPPEPEPGVTLVNLNNGTLEITPSGVLLREHRAEDFLTYCLPFDYNPKATCPKFDTYLQRVQPDEPARHILAEYVAAIFTTKEVFRFEKVLLLYGTGANGKSVFFDILNALLGKENITNFSLKHLNEEHNRAQIVNKLLNYGSEIGGNIDTELWKTIASNEPIQCRLKYGNSFIAPKYARQIFNCNVLPTTVEHTHGYFRRFLIIPFEVTIPEEERDLDLANNIIKEELPGVLNWVLKGLDRILRNKKFTYYPKVDKILSDFQKESDSVAMFLEEMNYQPSPEENEALKYVFQEYRSYCIDNGFKPVATKNFRKRLEGLGYVCARRSSGWTVYLSKVNEL